MCSNFMMDLVGRAKWGAPLKSVHTRPHTSEEPCTNPWCPLDFPSIAFALDLSPCAMGVARGLVSLLCLVGSADAFVSPFVGRLQSARNTG